MVGLGSLDPIDLSGCRLLSEPDIGYPEGSESTKASGHQETLTGSLSLTHGKQAGEQDKEVASWMQGISYMVAPDALLHWAETGLPPPSP